MNDHTNSRQKKVALGRGRKIGFWGLTVLMVLGVCFIITELLLRWLIPYPLGTNQTSICEIDPVLGWSIESNYNLSFLGADKQFSFKRSNHVGTLGPEIQIPKLVGTLRVLVTGDSHIHSSLSEEKTFTAHLRRALRRETNLRIVDVVNGAVAHYSPYQQLLRAIHLNTTIRPDAMIVCLYGGNDFLDLELSEGPVINDYNEGYAPAAFDNPRFRHYQTARDHAHQRSIIKKVKPFSRFFDLINFYQSQMHQNARWEEIKETNYERLENGPLANLSQAEIREMIPDWESYLTWSSWYTQGSKQNQYFHLHPERLHISRVKMRAVLAAFGVLQSRLNIPIYVLYLPTFLVSEVNKEPPFDRFNETFLMADISLTVKNKEFVQAWARQANLGFWDGEEILRETLEDTFWFHFTDCHLTSEAQKTLAHALLEPCKIVPINERKNYRLPRGFLENLPESEREFALNPQPRFPKWSNANPPADHQNYSIQLQRYMALSTPGPWTVGAVWQWKEKPDPEQTVYQVFWDTQSEPKRKVFRLPYQIDKLQSKEQTFWTHSGWYNEKRIPTLPDAISLEGATGEQITPRYILHWQ